MRTYRADDYHRAVEAWRDFGPEWAEVRQIANNFSVFPPNGTRHDDRETDHPSQRAIIWRALNDNPGELKRILRSASSWSQVCDRIFGLEKRLNEEAGEGERDAAWDRDQLPGPREAMRSIGDIFKQIEESLP